MLLRVSKGEEVTKMNQNHNISLNPSSLQTHFTAKVVWK